MATAAVDPTVRTVLPAACTLTLADGSARLRRWQLLQATAGSAARLDGGHLTVRYRSAPGVLAELTALAAAEQTCCAFVAWTVSTADGHPVLHVVAPEDAPDAVAPIAALFGVTAGVR